MEVLKNMWLWFLIWTIIGFCLSLLLFTTKTKNFWIEVKKTFRKRWKILLPLSIVYGLGAALIWHFMG
jgi:hypothetical protein